MPSTTTAIGLEFLPASLTDSLLRQELAEDELHIVDGEIPLPDRPGLGVGENRRPDRFTLADGHRVTMLRSFLRDAADVRAADQPPVR